MSTTSSNFAGDWIRTHDMFPVKNSRVTQKFSLTTCDVHGELNA